MRFRRSQGVSEVVKQSLAAGMERVELLADVSPLERKSARAVAVLDTDDRAPRLSRPAKSTLATDLRSRWSQQVGVYTSGSVGVAIGGEESLQEVLVGGGGDLHRDAVDGEVECP